MMEAVQFQTLTDRVALPLQAFLPDSTVPKK